MIQIYNYDVLNYFSGSSYARENPLQAGTYLMPARTTTDPPPVVADHQIAKWGGAAWSVDVDYRGTWYDIDTQARIDVWHAGEPQPTNTTDVVPPPGEPTWVFTGSVWERTLEVAKQEKKNEILTAYDAAIETPVVYDGHSYLTNAEFVTLLEVGIEVQAGMVDVYDITHNTYQLTEVNAKQLRDALYTTRLWLVLARESKLKAVDDASDIPTVDGISW